MVVAVMKSRREGNNGRGKGMLKFELRVDVVLCVRCIGEDEEVEYLGGWRETTYWLPTRPQLVPVRLCKSNQRLPTTRETRYSGSGSHVSSNINFPVVRYSIGFIQC